MTTNIDWTRINSDVNGNPRYVCHFLDLEPAPDYTLTLSDRYARVVKAANALGGRRYHNKQFGGGIVFQAYECQLPEIVSRIRAKLATR
jgi:hypothetical protein